MISPALSGDLGKAVQDAWKPLAAHSGACTQCSGPLLELKRAPDDPFPYYDACCADGQGLFIQWADAKIALISRLRDLTAPWGMAGLAGEEAEERSDAIVAMPGPAAAELFREPDAERRESVIRALIAAQRVGGVRARECGEERRQCAAEDCRTGPYGTRGSFVVDARWPRRRHCGEACRKRAGRQRPRLESTEEE